jgi:hypothetical protein
MKSGNADGAKGLSYSVLFDGQPEMGGALPQETINAQEQATK